MGTRSLEGKAQSKPGALASQPRPVMRRERTHRNSSTPKDLILLDNAISASSGNSITAHLVVIKIEFSSVTTENCAERLEYH
jgi:hypothetical protein